jgi:hypothetical protein
MTRKKCEMSSHCSNSIRSQFRSQLLNGPMQPLVDDVDKAVVVQRIFVVVVIIIAVIIVV